MDVTEGTVFGMSATAVTPPAAAARVPDWKSSLSVNPGSLKWTCMSIIPGRTRFPPAFNTLSASGVNPLLVRDWILPPSTTTLPSKKPLGVYILPSLTTRSTVKIVHHSNLTGSIN